MLKKRAKIFHMSFIGKNIKKIRTVKKLSQAQFAELFNLARPSVGAYEEGRTEPKIDTIIAMANYFGLSIDALLRKELTVNELYSLDILKGEFDPTQMPPALGKSQKKDTSQPSPVNTTQPLELGIPLVSRELGLEYIVNLGNKDFISKLPRVSLPHEPKNNQRAFVHSGQEMYHNESGLRQGDILLCTPESKEKLPSLKTGNVFVVVTPRRIVTRRLAAATKDSIELKADNPAFDNSTVGAEEILEIWEANGYWSEHLSPPLHMESRMFQLENRMQELEEKLLKISRES